MLENFLDTFLVHRRVSKELFKIKSNNLFRHKANKVLDLVIIVQ